MARCIKRQENTIPEMEEERVCEDFITIHHCFLVKEEWRVGANPPTT
jgi:hypothetical protein